MSYDLFVFEPEAMSKDRSAFDEWLVLEQEADDFSFDPTVSSPRLQKWFAEMQGTFPALNGPASPEDVENLEVVGDYTFRPNSIAVCIGWPSAQLAAQVGPEAAVKTGVGLFDPQGGERYLPQDGKLVDIDKPVGLFAKISKLFSRG